MHAASTPLRKASSQMLSLPMVNDSTAAAGAAPFPAKSDKLTVTSFHPTLPAGS
jgi:hypothetical protein